MSQDRFEDVTRAIDTTLISRRQLLCGLASSAMIVAFPILELGGRKLAYAQSDAEIALPPLETAEGLTKAAWLNHLSKLSPIERAREVQWTVNMMMASDAAGGSLSSLAFAQRSNENLDSFDSSVMRGETPETLEKMSIQDSILAVLQSISVGAGGDSVQVSLAPGPLYQEFMYKGAKEELDTLNQITAIQAQLEAVEQWNGLVDNIANKLVEKTRIDPVLRAGIKSKTGVDFALKDTYAVLDSQDAAFRNWVLTLNAIGPEGALTTSLFDLQERSIREFDTLKVKMADLTALLKTMDARQRSFVAWSLANAQAEQFRREAEAAAQQKAQEAQIILDGAKSAVSVLSTLIGLADKEAAKQVSVTLNSAIQIGDSINKFMTSVSTLGKVQTDLTQLAMGMSGAILTGNIVGAAMNIISVFTGAGQPSLEEQVAALRREMHERFDRIEANLNEIYDTILRGFDEVGTDVKFALQILAAIDLKLARLERNILESLQTDGRRPLFAGIDAAIHYKEKNNGATMPPDKFDEYKNLFHSWATINARDEVEQDTNGRGYEDADLLDELSRPLEDNVMYLATFLTRKYPEWNVPSFATGRLVNPMVWALSSRAYAELRLEWPAYAKGISSSRIEEVKQAGEEFQAAIRRITVQADTSTGPAPNHKLFDTLNANYKEKFSALQRELERIEEKYLDEFRSQRTQSVNVDFWGGPWQKTTYAPPLPPDPASAKRPNTIVSHILAPYLLAEYMGGSKTSPNTRLSVHYRSGWSEVTRERDFWGTTRLYALPTVRVIVAYGGSVPIVNRYVTGSRVQIDGHWTSPLTRADDLKLDPSINYWPWVDDHPWVLDHFWNFAPFGQDLRAKFDSGGSQEWPVDTRTREFLSLHLSQVCAEVGQGLFPSGQGLLEHQQNIYRNIAQGFDLGGTNPDPVLLNAARIFAGAKALYTAFVELGLPRALAADDFLRAMLYGNQSLVNDAPVRERYAAAALPIGTSNLIPADSYVSLRSFNYPTRLVRHRDGLADLTEIGTELDKQDATFKIVPGFEGTNTIAFESVNFPGTYLSHQDDYRLKLKPFSDDAFKAHATFSVVTGLWAYNGIGVSFRSYSHPDRYIRHRDFQMWVEPGSDSLFKKDATFIREIKNPRVPIKQDADWRVDALGTSLKGYLDQIGGGKHVELQPLVKTELLRSSVIDTIVEHTDTQLPKVSSVTPANNATGIKRNTNLTATFSEKMDPLSITKSTFKLFKVNTDGSTTQITNVTVTPSTDGLKATLNPFGTSTTLLAKSTRYKAVVTTGAKDVAGNPLDQNPTTSGNQQMVWSFKTGLQ